MYRACCYTVLFVLCYSSLGCFSVSEQRLLTVQIELNGDSVLESLWAVSDNLTKQETWKTLVNAPLHSVNRWQPAASTGDQATVSGNIVIHVNHADQEYITLKTNVIKLVKDKTSQWKLAKETVDKLVQEVK
jgi:hypothetical protein